MTTTAIKEAFDVSVIGNRYGLFAEVKMAMCYHLNCSPFELESALTDEVIEEIFS